MAETQQPPTNAVWDGLLAGDPGPAVALFDSLIDGDFGHAAGGLLRDLADATVNVDELIEEKSAQAQFLATIEAALLCCLQNDQQQLQELKDEAQSG